MPYVSEAQRRWAHTSNGLKALRGQAAVSHWDKATKGKKLPEHVAKKEAFLQEVAALAKLSAEQTFGLSGANSVPGANGVPGGNVPKAGAQPKQRGLQSANTQTQQQQSATVPGARDAQPTFFQGLSDKALNSPDEKFNTDATLPVVA
jgi:hypothetical protein